MPDTVVFYPDTIAMVNKLQAYRANRFIFSESTNFAAVEQLIKQDPQLKETDQRRWKIITKWGPTEGAV
jgi:hypothetical protein